MICSMKQPVVIRIVVQCSTNYLRVIEQITTSMHEAKYVKWKMMLFLYKRQLTLSIWSISSEYQAKNCKNMSALLSQNMMACTCMLGTEISFQVHVPKKNPKLYKILGTKLKGIGISWKRNLPEFGYTMYLARLQ